MPGDGDPPAYPGRRLLPSHREIGSLTLDLMARDARWDGEWLTLHPREFLLLWRLADTPGRVVTERTLLRDVWRLDHHPETNRVAVHVARLRAKLAIFGLGALVKTATCGGYFLDRAAMLDLSRTG